MEPAGKRWAVLHLVGLITAAVAGAACGSCRTSPPGRPSLGTGGAGGGGANGDGALGGERTTVVLFLIDGLMADAARTAAANGAHNIKFVLENGVSVETVYATSPAARLLLPNGALPWGNATSGNVAVHTGTHLFESDSRGMDDIFQAARAAGKKTVFSGGDANYAAFSTADFHYAGALADQVVVGNAIEHLKNDQARLIRVHLQRLRDDWRGPADKADPQSPYVRHIVANDALLGELIQALKDSGVWNQTFLIVTADHGMGQTAASDHPPSAITSWQPFLAFYGPGLKGGATIPYAELPDVAVTAARFLGLPPLAGHTDATVALPRRGSTGTVLENLFVGTPDDLVHPRFIERYLRMNSFPDSGDAYAPYRSAMLGILQ